MLFNSLDFAIFLPIVFVLYWLLNKNLRIQNLLIVIASYIFYGWWDWRFLSLIAFSTLVDYTVGLGLKNQEDQFKRKLLLSISIVVNLGLLGFFKYYNFFIENFSSAFSIFGYELSTNSLNIILPVGISFYTFQTLSYTLDVYRKNMEPTTDIISFAAYVSFFPQLVAGPIERATHLLPQFRKHREFNYTEASDGMRQILWGFVKKVVIADNCAVYANMIFNNSSDYSGSTLIAGALFFTFQIYGDFSGYSDIAIGTSRLFGFDLMRNFSYPYFSRDIAEFWRRWHISLSTWFRDYLYIPLGGSRGSLWFKIRNTMIIFVVSGFWHGANWTFIVWGALNALYFLPLLLSKKNRKHLGIVAEGKLFPNIKEIINMAVTFALTILAWIVFRAESMTHALTYVKDIFTHNLFSIPDIPRKAALTVILVIVFVVVEWLGREKQYALEDIGKKWHFIVRYLVFGFILFLIGMYMQTSETPFIYFQF